MNEVFAQKLRRWLVSAMTLLLGTVSASIATLLGQPCTSNVWTCIGMSAEPMAFFSILFVVLAIWHAFDFVQNRKPGSRLVSLLAGYPVLFGASSLLLLLLILNATGRFTVIRQCGDIFVILSQACAMTEPWLLRPMLGLFMLLPLLSLAKGIVAIRSRLLKRS